MIFFFNFWGGCIACSTLPSLFDTTSINISMVPCFVKIGLVAIDGIIVAKEHMHI
jgi:hypothetical protein